MRNSSDSRDCLGEWIDVVMLGLDGCWRTGASPTEIIYALLDKQTTNESRQWPDWRTADPDKAIEHVRAAEKAAPAGEGGKFSEFHEQQTRDGASVLTPAPLPPIPPGGYASAEPVAHGSAGAAA